MLEQYYNKHYIVTSEYGAITDAWSDGPHHNGYTEQEAKTIRIEKEISA